MSLLQKIQEERNSILEIASKHGAYNVRIFGSAARGEEKEESDIDLLVNFEEGRSLFDLIRFKQELEERFGYSVDIVTEKSLHPLIQNKVLGEAIQL
ncbi:nucleotidyltransferase family protein [Effusibacillus consociatus]|uniref:Nucleotidyltransferase family protein n=1 Tax=Effusibacillus consociatus TaxID=1117041 RepID=A0ABV9PYR5_9BACL